MFQIILCEARIPVPNNAAERMSSDARVSSFQYYRMCTAKAIGCKPTEILTVTPQHNQPVNDSTGLTLVRPNSVPVRCSSSHPITPQPDDFNRGTKCDR